MSLLNIFRQTAMENLPVVTKRVRQMEMFSINGHVVNQISRNTFIKFDEQN